MNSTARPRIGVLALQGGVSEHVRALRALGAEPVAVRRPAELDTVDALVLPGGESTTMGHLMGVFGLVEPLRARVAAGMPTYGSCAGMILLAEDVRDTRVGAVGIGGLDVTVRRNAFGRQVDSFETDLELSGLDGVVHAVFIRAPWVERVGARVQVLARVPAGHGAATGKVVAVRSGALLATSFHPEVTSDLRVHALFLDVVRAAGR